MSLVRQCVSHFPDPHRESPKCPAVHFQRLRSKIWAVQHQIRGIKSLPAPVSRQPSTRTKSGVETGNPYAPNQVCLLTNRCRQTHSKRRLERIAINRNGTFAKNSSRTRMQYELLPLHPCSPTTIENCMSRDGYRHTHGSRPFVHKHRRPRFLICLLVTVPRYCTPSLCPRSISKKRFGKSHSSTMSTSVTFLSTQATLCFFFSRRCFKGSGQSLLCLCLILLELLRFAPLPLPLSSTFDLPTCSFHLSPRTLRVAVRVSGEGIAITSKKPRLHRTWFNLSRALGTQHTLHATLHRCRILPQRTRQG